MNEMLYKNYAVIVRVNEEVEKIYFGEVEEHEVRSTYDAIEQEKMIASLATSYDDSAMASEIEFFDNVVEMVTQDHLNNQEVINAFNASLSDDAEIDDLAIVIDLNIETDNEQMICINVSKYAKQSFDIAYDFCHEFAGYYNKTREYVSVCVASDTELSKRIEKFAQKLAA